MLSVVDTCCLLSSRPLQVYDAISPHFSSTRFAVWPKCALQIQLPRHSSPAKCTIPLCADYRQMAAPAECLSACKAGAWTMQPDDKCVTYSTRAGSGSSSTPCRLTRWSLTSAVATVRPALLMHWSATLCLTACWHEGCSVAPCVLCEQPRLSAAGAFACYAQLCDTLDVHTSSSCPGASCRCTLHWQHWTSSLQRRVLPLRQ